MSKSKHAVHAAIKLRLGYDESMTDREFLKHWKKRSTQICKPCWELKYCPYGPFVEQSPLLPSTRARALEHHHYLKTCLATGQFGTTRPLDAETRERYATLLEVAKEDPIVLAKVVARNLYFRDLFAQAHEEGRDPAEVLAPPMSDFERYKVPFPLLDQDKDEQTGIEMTVEIDAGIRDEIERIEAALESGVDDRSRPLDEARRTMFQAKVDGFDPNEHPESIPEEVECMTCNIFGHICPVVFVAESITETTEKRRRGRYIPFKTKVRVVRRDNYTCQECGRHLRDDEVEFDHIIPHSRGGSSEEHNIRLTCFTCNRDKSATVKI